MEAPMGTYKDMTGTSSGLYRCDDIYYYISNAFKFYIYTVEIWCCASVEKSSIKAASFASFSTHSHMSSSPTSCSFFAFCEREIEDIIELTNPLLLSDFQTPPSCCPKPICLLESKTPKKAANPIKKNKKNKKKRKPKRRFSKAPRKNPFCIK